MKRVVLAGAALAALMAGCSSSGSGAGGGSAGPGTSSGSAALKGSITVYAASSLTEAFNTIKDQFTAAHPGTSITITFGASSDLSTQISQGAPADVFASAAEKNMQSLGSTAVQPADFVSNTAEIAVPPNNPAHITSVQDLAKAGVKVALCDPAVPCGVVAAQVFKNANITVHPTATEANVAATLAAVTSNEVDAGVVYITDVRGAGNKVKGVVIPTDLNAKTTYPIATIKGSKNASLAQAFVAYVRSAAGQQVLTADGFANP